MGFSLVSVRGGNSLVAVRELLIAVASLWSTDSRELGFQKLQHMGSVVVVPRLVVAQALSCPERMWDLPGSGMEPKSPALAGGFFTMEPPGKPKFHILKAHFLYLLLYILYLLLYYIFK